MKDILIFSKSVGQNSRQDPSAIPYDVEEGITAFSATQNVDVDDAGLTHSRKRERFVLGGHWTDLFCRGDIFLGVKDGILFRILEDETEVFLRSGFSDRVSFTEVNGEIYYTCGDMKGIVGPGGHRDWVQNKYVGRKTDVVFSPPFAARHVEYHAGRMWLANENFICFSEPFGWSFFDLGNCGFLVDSDVKMIKSVVSGLFISTATTVYFFSGDIPTEDAKIRPVLSRPAKEWSVSQNLIPAKFLGIESAMDYAVWLMDDDVVAGGPDGSIISLAYDRVVFPETSDVGATALSGNNIIFTMGV